MALSGLKAVITGLIVAWRKKVTNSFTEAPYPALLK
jgi:hypothetical protein